MSVTEFATLELLATNTLYTSPIREHLNLASSRQASWSGYPVTFYKDMNQSSIFYLISGWKDVEAHGDWIRSPGNQELLQLLEPYITVKGLAHLDIDFDDFPKDGEGILVVSKNAPYKTLQAYSKWVKEGVDLEIESRPKYHFALFDDASVLERESKEGGLNFIKRIQDL